MGTTSSRNGDAPKPRKQPVRRRVDLRVSYRKAVEAITPHLAYTDLTLARRSAEGILGEILTPKQRDHLREVGDT
jgi:hypothetical protein